MPKQPASDSAVMRVYKILRWVMLACLLLIVLLALHKSPAPNVAVDPAAATRAAQKFAAADEAKADGQPAQVQLDSTELNSYLAQNLQTQGSPQAVTPGAPLAAPDSSAPVSSATPTPTPAAADPNAAGQGQPSLEEVQSSVRDVKVDMDGDLIKAYVVFNLHGQDLSLELDGHLSTEDGYMKFEPVAGKLGSLPLPQSVLDAAVDKLMNSPENREKLRLPDDVNNIQIQDGQAVVSYK
ncbi:MAG TPA: hypothetical protein VMB47_04215 [Candidatus Aquilonibacter sp.]|nr:hypothetical protein [Candidatus Aquilonibacter sp.]